MSGVLLDLEQRLLAQGFDRPIALGRLPDQPDAVLALIERPALPSRDHDGRELPALETLRVQLIARAGKDEGIGAADQIARTAYLVLVGRHLAITTDGRTTRYDWIRAQHTPAPVGFDALDRPMASTNLAIQRHGRLADPPFTSWGDTDVTFGELLTTPFGGLE